MGILEVIAFT